MYGTFVISPIDDGEFSRIPWKKRVVNNVQSPWVLIFRMGWIYLMEGDFIVKREK